MENRPLVTISIPTFNRGSKLNRAIKSALEQDYKNIEVIISDNASIDNTEEICTNHAKIDSRVIYIKQPLNKGPLVNYNTVLNQASGQYFMWLGDDDWIDSKYITVSLGILTYGANVSLVSGTPKYYKDSKYVYTGKTFSLTSQHWWKRVIKYYHYVGDNGMFYGLMKTPELRAVSIRNTIGGDWLLTASVAASGKTVMVKDTTIHRDLGGASNTPYQIVKTLKLPKWQAFIPKLSIGVCAALDIMYRDKSYLVFSTPQRVVTSLVVFLILLWKELWWKMDNIVYSIIKATKAQQ